MRRGWIRQGKAFGEKIKARIKQLMQAVLNLERHLRATELRLRIAEVELTEARRWLAEFGADRGNGD